MPKAPKRTFYRHVQREFDRSSQLISSAVSESVQTEDSQQRNQSNEVNASRHEPETSVIANSTGRSSAEKPALASARVFHWSFQCKAHRIPLVVTGRLHRASATPVQLCLHGENRRWRPEHGSAPASGRSLLLFRMNMADEMEVVFGLVEDSESSDSSRDSSSSEGGSAYLNAFETFFSLPLMRPKIGNFIDDTVHRYSDNEFRRNFRLSRDVCDTLVRGFAASPYNPAGNRGGSPPKSPEEHVLAFLWYAGNKCCIRDVAGRFNVGETTMHRIIGRVVSFLLDKAGHVIKFPSDLDALARDFQEE